MIGAFDAAARQRRRWRDAAGGASVDVQVLEVWKLSEERWRLLDRDGAASSCADDGGIGMLIANAAGEMSLRIVGVLPRQPRSPARRADAASRAYSNAKTPC